MVRRRTTAPGGLARLAVATTAALALVVSLGGCAPGDTRPKIALLLPDAKTARYESFDRPLFESAVAALGAYDVLYANADQDAAEQQAQAESALAAGARVLVVDPVDSAAAASIVAAARADGVPVVAYDRFISGGAAYFVGFDAQKVGELQATALVAGLDERGTLDAGGIIEVNGSPTDDNAGQYADGAASVFRDSGVEVLASYSTPDWSPDKAQEWVAGQVTLLGSSIVGVYAANDGVAGGAIAALKAANVSPLPIVTGQDADLAALQRVVSGDQYMTVYKPIGLEAQRAAEVAVDLLSGTSPPATTTVDGVPSTQYQPVAVTVHDIMSTVVADGFWTVQDICTPGYAAACEAAGIR